MSDDPADCRVWWMDPVRAPGWCAELLSEPEQARAESYHRAADRQRFTAATALLKLAVAESAECHPFEVRLRRECPDCHRLHGRPEVVGGTPYVSLSHSGRRVAVAVCAAGPVGVDVEQMTPGLDADGMAPMVFGETERLAFDRLTTGPDRLRAFFRCWTRKESVLKATGDGLRVLMSHVTLAEEHGRPRLTGFTGRPQLIGAAQITDLCPGAGYAGAVTVLSARPVRVRELDGADAFDLLAR